MGILQEQKEGYDGWSLTSLGDRWHGTMSEQKVGPERGRPCQLCQGVKVAFYVCWEPMKCFKQRSHVICFVFQKILKQSLLAVSKTLISMLFQACPLGFPFCVMFTCQPPTKPLRSNLGISSYVKPSPTFRQAPSPAHHPLFLPLRLRPHTHF